MPRSPEAASWRLALSQAVRLVRRLRSLTVRELAQRMGMKPRSFEYFQSGRAQPNLERIHQLARVSDVDAHAIVAAIMIGSPRFAIRAADNRCMSALMLCLQEFDEDVGDDIALLQTGDFVSAFSAAFGVLSSEAQRLAALRRPLSPDPDASA